jgi:hypothetical protein
VALSQLQLALLLTRRVTRCGAPDPGGSAAASTACGPACEGKNPTRFLGRNTRCSTPGLKGAASRLSLAGGEANRCWTTCPKARLGLTKQTDRQAKGRPLAGFGTAAAKGKATGGVAGVAGAAGLDSRACAKQRGSGSRDWVRRCAGGCTCACARGCVVRHGFVSARVRVGVGFLAGPAVAARAMAPSTGKTPHVLR